LFLNNSFITIDYFSLIALSFHRFCRAPLSYPGYIIIGEVNNTANRDTGRKYAEVIIDSPLQELDRPFTYRIPPETGDRLEIGSLVLVPFSGRSSVGYVVGFPAKSDVPYTKEIARVLDEPPVFDFDTQRLCRWIATHYLSSLSQAFKLVIPPGRGRKVKQHIALLKGREDSLFVSSESGLEVEIVEVLSAASGELEVSTLKKHIGTSGVDPAVRSLEEAGLVKRRFTLSEPSASPRSRLAVRLTGALTDTDRSSLPNRQREIIEYLEARGGNDFKSDLLRGTCASTSSVKSLENKGLLEITREEVLRQPNLSYTGKTGVAPTPNENQRTAIHTIGETIEAGLHKVFLLEGVTGSGKTEVYLRSIDQVIKLGKRAIVLVPEISLTPQTVERFESRFRGRVAVLHSRLSPGERYDQWRGVAEGRYDVVVGARSALFAPVSNLGLIAIDEEHEPSYKSDTAPRYHAREVAEVKARMCGAVLILGSATPSFETLTKARAGAYVHLVLPNRVDNRPLPEVEVVDMRQVGGAGKVPLLSSPLLDALSRTVASGDQAILFLNRRGFANYMQCHSCGEIMGCDECEVSLCYHTRGNMLLCHHCGMRRDVPKRCPSCDKGPLKSFGAGTQRVEDELIAHLPGIPFIRMDTDTTTSKDSHRRLLGSFARGEAQVLIGTQMIAKGLDIPGVTLVGVINADTALALPDFRASERTYQLLTQVSGRAGRGLRPGRVIIQTFNSSHPAVTALTGEIDRFIDSELNARLHARYPPFVELVNIMVTSTELPTASRSAERLRALLETDLSGTGALILGPAPSPLSRLRGLYRWHILVKTTDLDSVAERIRVSVSRLYDYSRSFPAGKDVRVSIDVDPVSLL
jgi:primosomal protein N' (replication factor Y) (superfamily II helicase)